MKEFVVISFLVIGVAIPLFMLLVFKVRGMEKRLKASQVKPLNDQEKKEMIDRCNKIAFILKTYSYQDIKDYLQAYQVAAEVIERLRSGERCILDEAIVDQDRLIFPDNSPQIYDVMTADDFESWSQNIKADLE